MENFIIFIIGYALVLLFWIIFVLLLFALSFIIKKNLVAIPVGLTYLISLAIQWFIFGYAIYLLWQIVSHGQWILFILALVFGGFIMSWWEAIYSLMLMPFQVSAMYFLEKVEKTDFGDESITGEVLDEKGNVVGISQSETSLKRNFAKYFLAVYLYNLVYLIISPGDRTLAPFEYITTPFFQIISLTLLVGIPYGIYRKIRHKSFFTKDKRYFFIQTWKTTLYIFIPLSVILYILTIRIN